LCCCRSRARNGIHPLAKRPAYDRTRRLSETMARAGAHMLTVETPPVEVSYSILYTIIPFNFMVYFLAEKLNVGETFVVGG
jgi:glutamine---fructose-6-phosphate transaminase (isomerizing)